jgi:ribosome-binding factor A
MEELSTRQNKIARLIHREMADILLKVNKTKFTGKLITV